MEKLKSVKIKFTLQTMQSNWIKSNARALDPRAIKTIIKIFNNEGEHLIYKEKTLNYNLQ